VTQQGGLEPDRGLARERTRLAWVRTALTFVGVGALIVRRDLIIGLLVLAVVPLIWVLGRTVSRPAVPGAQPRRLLLVTVVVVLVSLLAAVAALLGHGPSSLSQLLSGRS